MISKISKTEISLIFKGKKKKVVIHECETSMASHILHLPPKYCFVYILVEESSSLMRLRVPKILFC